MTTLNAKIVIGAVVDGARKALQQLGTTVAQTTQAIEKADAKTPFSKAKQGVESISAQLVQLRRLAIGAFGVQQLRSLAETVDNYASLSARLRLATQSQQEFTTAQRELAAVANRNQVGLSETVQLYTRLAPAVRQVGGSQREALQITEAVALSLRVSGATAAESASAILQFSQALGAGALRGEEFNAIAEASPRLMQALADGLGKSRGELRGLAEQGKLTAGVVGNALIGQLSRLREEAGRLPQTIGGSLQRVKNAFTAFVGESTAIGTVARAIATAFDLVADSLTAVVSGIGLLAAAWYGAKFGLLLAPLLGIAPALLGPAGAVVAVTALTAAVLALGRAREKLDTLSGEELVTRKAAVNAELDRLIAQGGADETEIERLLHKLNLLNQEIERRRALKAAADEERREANRAGVLSGRARGLREDPAVSDRVAQFKGYFDQRLELQRDAIARELKLANEGFQQGLLDRQTYFDRRARLEEQAYAKERVQLERELAGQRKTQATNEQRLAALKPDDKQREQFSEALAAGNAEIARTLTQLAVLDRNRADAARDLADQRERAAAAAERELRALDQEAKATLGRESVADVQARVADQFAERRAREFNLTGDTAQTDALVARMVAQEQLNQLTTDYQRLQQQRQTAEAELARQLEAGTIGQQAFNDKVAELRSAGLPALQALLAEMERIAGAAGPDAEDAVAQLKVGLQQVVPEAVTFKKQVGDALQGGLTDLFTDLITGAKSVKQAFADMARAVLAEIARIIAAKAAAQLVSSFLFHGGGVVGAGDGLRRRVDPALFALAPRFHAGGVAGLHSGEVPAILQAGEEVLTRQDPRHRANGGGLAGINVNVSVSGGGAPVDQRRAGDELGRMVEATVEQWALRQSRPGGILWSPYPRGG